MPGSSNAFACLAAGTMQMPFKFGRLAPFKQEIKNPPQKIKRL